MSQLFVRSAVFALLGALTLAGTAKADDDRIFDTGIGVGGTMGYVTPVEPPEVLIKVETNFCKKVTDSLCVVLLRGSATGSISATTGTIGNVDMNYDIVGGEFDVNGDQSVMLGASLLSVSVERKIAIDEDHFIRISFAGFRGHGKIDVNKDLELFAKASIDILGLAYARTITQNREVSGISQSASLELGALIYKRVRVSLSERLGLVTGGDNVSIPSSTTTCTTTTGTTQTDPPGPDATQTCTQGTQSVPRDQMWSSVTSVSVKVNLMKHVLLFVQGSYSYFHFSDQLGGATAPQAPPITTGGISTTTVPVNSPISSGLGVLAGEIGIEVIF